MKFLITGAKGQLGREWVKQLTRLGTDFMAPGSGELDITDSAQIAVVLDKYRPDVVINCAAYTKVDLAEDEAERSYSINAKAVADLAGLCKARNMRLVHYSTDYVFSGKREDMEVFPEGYREEHPTDPINTYGASKRRGEQAIIDSGCVYLILRVSWLCGAEGHNFVKTMLRLAEERKELNVVNDQFGSPTYASNVVLNSLALINQKESGLFHLSSTGMCSWFELAQEIFAQTGTEIQLHAVDSSAFPTKAVRPAFSKLNTQKIATIPGIELLDWKTGLRDLLKELA